MRYRKSDGLPVRRKYKFKRGDTVIVTGGGFNGWRAVYIKPSGHGCGTVRLLDTGNVRTFRNARLLTEAEFANQTPLFMGGY